MIDGSKAVVAESRRSRTAFAAFNYSLSLSLAGCFVDGFVCLIEQTKALADANDKSQAPSATLCQRLLLPPLRFASLLSFSFAVTATTTTTLKWMPESIASFSLTERSHWFCCDDRVEDAIELQ